VTPIFNPLRLCAVALDVLAVDHGTPDAILARQRMRLVHLLNAAMQGSRLYGERLRGISAANVELSALPLVGKTELMQRFDDWVTDPEVKLVELRAFTADQNRIAEPYLGKYVVWESSGSSGQPGIFVQDARAMASYDALEALRRCTPQPLQRWLDPLYLSERMAFVGATGGHFASFVSVQRLRQVNPWVAPAMRSFSILQSTSTLIAELNEFAPTLIATYPTVAALLAEEALRGSLHIAPREVLTGGETLTPGVRQRVEQAMGATVRNSYGASEFLSIAWECAQGQLHVNADWVILEPVDEKHRPVPVGEQSHSTLLTNLANTVQPLIRYDLGDQITVSPERCSCGSPLPVIQVSGRRDDALTMRGRDGQAVTLLPLALTTLLEDEAGVFDFQLRQRGPHSLELYLPQRGAEGAAALERCRKLLQAFARQQGLEPLHIIDKSGTVLRRGRSGKVQRVVACAP
jgi:phenylacetate-coenzyme A ligase PaaK-like adenylate-forming protein